MNPLLEAALAARAHAFAPYSRFPVGAAVRTRSGKIFTGCNVESTSYGLTICAERVALCSAVAAGERHIVEIAVVADCPVPVPPCGACRQMLHDFGAGATLWMANLTGAVRSTTLSSLLPEAFTDGMLPHEPEQS